MGFDAYISGSGLALTLASSSNAAWYSSSALNTSDIKTVAPLFKIASLLVNSLKAGNLQEKTATYSHLYQLSVVLI